MTLATATLERFATTLTTLTPVTETPVVRNPTTEESIAHGPNHLIYVTRIESDRNSATYVGRVLRCYAANSGDGWLHESANDGVVRVYGAVLNDTMVNGHYYRTLNARNLVARYNDSDHAGDRHVPSLPLSMIAGDGTPWPFPNDGMSMWEDTPYIEVEAPALSPAAPSFGEVSVDILPELTDAHQFLPATAPEFDPSFGFGLPGADGRVRLNPDLEVGEMYIFWSAGRPRDRGSMSEVRMVTALPAGDETQPRFAHLGYWNLERDGGEDKPYFYTGRRSVLDEETEKAWVKLALTVPANDTNTDTSEWTGLQATERTEFAEFNEATNELAADNDWCTEYEDIVTKVGMEGRTKKVHDYDVDVTASITFEADSISSRIDTHVANDYDIPGFCGNSARFRGDVTVTIRISDVDDDDDAADQIDSDTVYEHINNMMSGIDDLEIDDYNISTTRQVD